jgi:mannose-6-phosphate isomerase-like protein (cupin superfamily)
MQHKRLQFGKGFRPVLGDQHSQAVQMTFGTGENEGGLRNRHAGADQWLYVVSGSGIATLNGARLAISEGTLLLIQRGDTHEIRNTGNGALKMLNIYPPAYTNDGEELPAGKG